MAYPALQMAISRLAELFDGGALLADTDPTGFIDHTTEEVTRLRAKVEELRKENWTMREGLLSIQHRARSYPGRRVANIYIEQFVSQVLREASTETAALNDSKEENDGQQ